MSTNSAVHPMSVESKRLNTHKDNTKLSLYPRPPPSIQITHNRPPPLPPHLARLVSLAKMPLTHSLPLKTAHRVSSHVSQESDQWQPVPGAQLTPPTQKPAPTSINKDEEKYLVEFFLPLRQQAPLDATNFLIIPTDSIASPSTLPQLLSSHQTITSRQIQDIRMENPQCIWTWDRLTSGSKLSALHPLKVKEPYQQRQCPFTSLEFPSTFVHTEMEEEVPIVPVECPELDDDSSLCKYPLRSRRPSSTRTAQKSFAQPKRIEAVESVHMFPSDEEFYPLIRACEPGSVAWLVQQKHEEHQARKRTQNIQKHPSSEQTPLKPTLFATEE